MGLSFKELALLAKEEEEEVEHIPDYGVNPQGWKKANSPSPEAKVMNSLFFVPHEETALDQMKRHRHTRATMSAFGRKGGLRL